MKQCFFDHNATTPLCPEAKRAWIEASDEHWLNPSSPYRAAAAAKVRLEAAREELASLLGVAQDRLIFNSGATEGNNSVFAHWAENLRRDAKIAVSRTEHPSVIEAAKHYFDQRVVWLPIKSSGGLDAACVTEALDQDRSICAVSVMAANNETGILNDWKEIAALCRARSIDYHCDASQWIGKMPVQGLDRCRYVTGCAHKFGGPKGIGFLVLPDSGTDYHSFLGGEHESGHRAGTEDLASVLSMTAALKSTRIGSSVARDRFIERLLASMPEIEVVGQATNRLWNTVSLLMPEFESRRWIRGLEKRGFLVAAGSACSTGKEGPSHVLAAMGVDPAKARRALRISSDWKTKDEDWESLAQCIEDLYRAFRLEAKQSPSEVISI